MPDDLRERIAAAVARELVQQAQAAGEYQTRDCYKVADAVIRKLGLRLDSTCHIHDREGKQRCIRYVTGWEVDE